MKSWKMLLKEKKSKNWKKEWKWNFIRKVNPNILDLRNELD